MEFVYNIEKVYFKSTYVWSNLSPLWDTRAIFRRRRSNHACVQPWKSINT